MYTIEEIYLSAILNEKLESYISDISSGKRPVENFSLHNCEGLKEWAVSHDIIDNVHMVTITKQGRAIVAIAQESKNERLPLMTENQLTDESNIVLTTLNAKLTAIKQNNNTILSGYKNGAAFAEILSCKFHTKCISYYSPGVKKLMPAVKMLKDFRETTEEDNIILGIDGEPNDYNTRYGSISCKVRLPIPFYDEASTREARTAVKDLLISTGIISAAMSALPYGGIIKQLSVLFPFLFNPTTINLTLIESFIEITNFGFYGKKIQSIIDKSDAKQHEMKSFLDVIVSEKNGLKNLRFQFFTCFEWPEYNKNAIRKGVDYVLNSRSNIEIARILHEEFSYAIKEHFGKSIFHQYLNESKNNGLNQLTETAPSCNLLDINRKIKRYNTVELDNETVLISEDISEYTADEENKVQLSTNQATTKNWTVRWMDGLANAGMQNISNFTSYFANQSNKR